MGDSAPSKEEKSAKLRKEVVEHAVQSVLIGLDSRLKGADWGSLGSPVHQKSVSVQIPGVLSDEGHDRLHAPVQGVCELTIASRNRRENQRDVVD